MLVCKATSKGRHHSLTCQNGLLHLRVGCWITAGHCGFCKEAVEIGRDFLQTQVVVAVAVGAAHFVKVLPCCLLGRELYFCVTTSYADDEKHCDRRCGRSDDRYRAKLLFHVTRLRLLGKLAADVIPVHDLEERLDVIGAAVLVLEVIGVFPDVNSEDGLVAEG